MVSPSPQRRKSQLFPMLLLGLGIIMAIGFAMIGFFVQSRTEIVYVAAREIPEGKAIVAEDIAPLVVPANRPEALRGITSQNRIVGFFARTTMRTNDLIRVEGLASEPPTSIVYANGRKLQTNMVEYVFPLAQGAGVAEDRLPSGAVLPTANELVNIGYYGSPIIPEELCSRSDDAAPLPVPSFVPPVTPPNAASSGIEFQNLAEGFHSCRFLTAIPVLFTDVENRILYLEVTPYQAAILRLLATYERADLGSGSKPLVQWVERVSRESDQLKMQDRFDLDTLETARLTASITNSLSFDPEPLSYESQQEGVRP